MSTRSVKVSIVIDLLLESPFDDELRLVVADAMQQAGNPQGELAILQSRSLDDPAIRTRHDELVHQILPVAAPFSDDPDQILAVAWHLGWIHRARLQLTSWNEAATAPMQHLEALLASPASRLIEHLELRVGTRWSREAIVEDYLMKLIEHAPYPALRTIEIGCAIVDSHPERDISAVYICNHPGWVAWSRFANLCPRLEVLRVAGNVFEMGPLALPELRELAIRTSSFGQIALAGFDRSTLPALERCTVWFGDCGHGAIDQCEPADIIGLVHHLDEHCPRLQHLALANLPCADGVIDALPAAGLLGRLVSLDLSLGTLASVDSLVALRPCLAALKVLDVRDNYLTSNEQDRLLDAFAGCEVAVAPQRVVSDVRYPSVGE